VAVDDWGITEGYHDVAGVWHPIDPVVRDRIRASMGEPRPGRPLWFVEQGTHHRLWNACTLTLEDGTSWGRIDELTEHVPIGYHDLAPVDGSPATRLIVHPSRCPELPHGWGVAAQIYALWSDRSWGIGDLRDLRTLAERVVAVGGSAILVSPLHQPAPSLPQEPSPYYPSSRRAWNPMLLAIDAPVPERLRCAAGQLIDRDDAWIAKRSLLEAEFDVFDHPGIEPSSIARWNAHCDILLADWRDWPTDLTAIESDEEWQRRARFHEWLQQRIAAQLAEVAATGVQVIGDLAVGFSPNGADAHEFRDLLALDMRIGAPPDKFNTAGQEWGIPPFVPWKLRAAAYEPFIQTVRAALRGVSALRMDHVMGLFRQYWVPAGGSPTEGAYVRFPADELLAIICLEATRAGAFVVGEDLGTVELEVRDTLAARGIAGTKVLWFEEDPPATWPESALATVTTHDLPTVAGVWQRGETGDPADAADDEVFRRLQAVAPAATTAAEAAAAANAVLLAASSRLRLVTTDDLAVAVEQPNLPGQNDHPNWRIRLPLPVSQLL
jgi:4-alpha-glucanotransferase